MIDQLNIKESLNIFIVENLGKMIRKMVLIPDLLSVGMELRPIGQEEMAEGLG